MCVCVRQEAVQIKEPAFVLLVQQMVCSLTSKVADVMCVVKVVVDGTVAVQEPNPTQQRLAKVKATEQNQESTT